MSCPTYSQVTRHTFTLDPALQIIRQKCYFFWQFPIIFLNLLILVRDRRHIFSTNVKPFVNYLSSISPEITRKPMVFLMISGE